MVWIFTKRLAFALEMYMDVFWDKQLQAGEYPEQLKNEIEKRKYFIFVMTPCSIYSSEWCQNELNIAKAKPNSDEQIVPVRIYYGSQSIDDELALKYTYGNFVDDFEVGFRCITRIMLKTPYSSWEYLANNSNYELSDKKSLPYALANGQIPCLIVKQLSSWLLAEKLWAILKPIFEKADSTFSITGHPRTASGFKKIGDDLIEIAAKLRDAGLAGTTTRWINPIIDLYQQIGVLTDSQHQEAGHLMSVIIKNIYQHLESDSVANRNPHEVVAWRKYFHFDVYEKLRELITYYANTSRRLY